MYNQFLYKQLVFTAALTLSAISAISSQHSDLYEDRALDLGKSVHEELYHHAIQSIDPTDDIIDAQRLDQDVVISLLNTRYPELAYKLERTPKQTLAGKEISALLVDILKKETSDGVSEVGGSFWNSVEDASLNYEEESVFKFLYAYSLFSQKRFSEADRIFEKIIKERKGEYEYAFYYSGLIALLEKDYEKAHERLTKVGKDEKLSAQTPYYLAATHYGKKDYASVIKYYEPRVRETSLHNIDGLIRLVGYAQYKTQDFESAVASLKLLQSKRELSQEESYVLGIAYQRIGDHKSSSEHLGDVAGFKTNISERASYENALNLAHIGNTPAAITAFENLIGADQISTDDIHLNLAMLHSKSQNYEKAVHHAKLLLDSPRKEQARGLIVELIDEVENESVYEHLVKSIAADLDDTTPIENSIYRRGLVALQAQDKTKAKEYFDLLADINPRAMEQGNLAAWRGIMAYEEENYSKAIRLLTNYQNTRSVDSPLSKLDFDVAYFLGYSTYRQKDHNSALGHFGKALDYVHLAGTEITSSHKAHDIHLRLGDSYFLLSEYDDAARSYDAVIKENGLNTDYAIWQNSIISELSGKPYDQILLLQELISDHRSSKYQSNAQFSIANAFFAVREYDKAAEWYKTVISSDASSNLKEESGLQMGLISVNAGDYDRAEDYFKSLINTSEDQDIVSRSHRALSEIYTDYTYDTDAYVALVNRGEEGQVGEIIFQLAQENYEKGEYSQAIKQWKKLIEEYPEEARNKDAHFLIAQAYDIEKNWLQAAHYYSLSVTDETSKKQESLQRALDISYDHIGDMQLYVDIAQREGSTTDPYRLALAYQQLGDQKNMLTYASESLSAQSLTSQQKNNLVIDFTADIASKSQWSDLISWYNEDDVKSIVDKNPKLIYHRGLALYNSDQLETAELSITDHYDTLLDDPAWLAKSIMLVADIYVAQDDVDSASAALEALISSSSNIPPSLKEMAKEKLKSLQPQN